MIDGNQAAALILVVGTVAGMGLFALFDIKVVQPWRKRRHETK